VVATFQPRAQSAPYRSDHGYPPVDRGEVYKDDLIFSFSTLTKPLLIFIVPFIAL
jgi:hypothetical protein